MKTSSTASPVQTEESPAQAAAAARSIADKEPATDSLQRPEHLKPAGSTEKAVQQENVRAAAEPVTAKAAARIPVWQKQAPQEDGNSKKSAGAKSGGRVPVWKNTVLRQAVSDPFKQGNRQPAEQYMNGRHTGNEAPCGSSHGARAAAAAEVSRLSDVTLVRPAMAGSQMTKESKSRVHVECVRASQAEAFLAELAAVRKELEAARKDLANVSGSCARLEEAMQQVLAELAALRQACHQNKQHCNSGSCHKASWFEDGAQNGHAHDAWQGADPDTHPSGVNQNWGFSQLSKEDQVRASLISQLPSPKICQS